MNKVTLLQQQYLSGVINYDQYLGKLEEAKKVENKKNKLVPDEIIKMIEDYIQEIDKKELENPIYFDDPYGLFTVKKDSISGTSITLRKLVNYLTLGTMESIRECKIFVFMLRSELVQSLPQEFIIWLSKFDETQ